MAFSISTDPLIQEIIDANTQYFLFRVFAFWSSHICHTCSHASLSIGYFLYDKKSRVYRAFSFQPACKIKQCERFPDTPQKFRNSPKRAYQFNKPPWLLLPEPETWSNPCYTSLLPPCSGQIFGKPSWLSQHLFVRIPWSLFLSTSYRYRSLLELLFWIIGKYATMQGAAAARPFA